MSIRARILGGGVAAILAVLLAACTGGVDDPVPTVDVESLTVPDAMLQSATAIDRGGAFLPASGDLPFAFGGAATEPGASALPAVWTSEDATSWQRAIVDPEFDGSFSGSLAGSAEVAALGGVAWRDRAYTSVLWVSADRATWEPVDLPEDFASRYRLGVLSVVDDRVFAIGRATDGETAAIVVSGDDVSTVELPELTEGEFLSPVDLAGSGSELVLIAKPGPEGEPADIVSFASDDAGESWSGPHELTEATSWVAGVVWTGSEYVATGDSPRNAAAGASTRASSWVSADGTSWSKEAVPVPPQGSSFFLVDAADEWLGAPTTADGVVTAVGSNANSAVSALFTRSASGAWTFGGTTTKNQASGEVGIAAPAGEGSAAVLVGGNGYLRTGSFSDGSFSEGVTLADREFLAVVNDVFPGEDRVEFVLRQSVFQVDSNLAWRNTSRYSLARYTGGDAVTAIDWDPERVGDLLNVRMATDDAGASIVIGSEFPKAGSVILAEGFHKAVPDADWTPMTGFSTEGATEFDTVKSTGDGWVAVGEYRTSTNAGTPSHAVAWASTDGIAWTRQAGDFGEGLLESALSDVCVLPDGTPLGLGWTEVSGDSFRMTAWSPRDGTWSKLDLGEFGEREGYGSTCANDEDGVVVSATIAGRNVLLRTTTGSDWRQVFKAERGVSLFNPVTVPGGFAAAGSWSNDTTAGAVVWLSRDGIEWEPVAIPSRNSASTGLVAAFEGDLLVTLPATSGDPILVVRDIEKVIDELVPKTE
jgi:hypothetical protein